MQIGIFCFPLKLLRNLAKCNNYTAVSNQSAYFPFGVKFVKVQHCCSKPSISICCLFQVEMSFRSFATDGVLLYGGSGGGSGAGNDYFVIKLDDSHVVFEYDLGGGPVVLKSAARVSPGHWTELKAKRYHQDGLLEVGPHGARVTGSATGSLRTLNIPSVVWVGATPPGSEDDGLRSFVGCLKNVKIGRKPLILNGQHEQEQVLERKNVRRYITIN